jgi:hypothetical protein
MGNDQRAARTPLLSSAFINTDDQQDDIRLTILRPNRRSSSVSRVPIPDDAPASLSFHEINYSIGSNMELNKRWLKCPPLQPAEYKQILWNISGRFSKGMNAILGEIYYFTLVFVN